MNHCFKFSEAISLCCGILLGILLMNNVKEISPQEYDYIINNKNISKEVNKLVEKSIKDGKINKYEFRYVSNLIVQEKLSQIRNKDKKY